jgi:hypothetical protein
MKAISRLLTILALLCSSYAFSHGEDKAGPHHGFVRMPGAFHTEVVPSPSPQELQIYLLDISWKNPTVKNSSVEILFKNSMAGFMSCPPREGQDFFFCRVPADVDLKKPGQFIIKAKRNGQVGNDAVYDLPLALKKSHQEH